MCGIAGYYGKGRPELVGAMMKRLSHRGPDEQGLQETATGCLGQVRLSILDLNCGHQPMGFEGTWIAFNGEIYNYRQLQRHYLPELCPKGHSDTEILLHLYRKLGSSMVRVLDGMFALAVLHEGELCLMRDPLGIKPLYISQQDECLFFASEIHALGVAGGRIQEFPAGHCFHSRRGWECYYKLEDEATPYHGTRDAAMDDIQRTLGEAVRKRLLSDVPVGISLSGGLDSSLVALLARPHSEHLQSFAVGMEGSEDLAAARVVADKLELQHHELVHTEEEILAVVPRVIRHLESCDAALVRSAIPNYLLASFASKHVKVILTGEGADELYGGYDYMAGCTTPEQLQEELLLTTKALHNTNLQRADRVPMAFGLEARVPFLDKASTALALGFPAAWKLHQKAPPKALLRDAFKGQLPDGILNRPKQKFSKGAGTKDVLRQLAEDSISDSAFTLESEQLRKNHGWAPTDKESLYCARILFESNNPSWILPNMGVSRSL